MASSTRSSCTWPVGFRYVSGGKRNSFSAGNADKKEISGPRAMKLDVKRRSSSERSDAEYSIAILSDDVVDIGASSVPPLRMNSSGTFMPLMP
eukprot:5561249-Prymnesium_polylepis.1